MSGPSQAGLSVRQAYEAELAARGYTSDPAQLRAVAALERCATEWAQYKEKRSNGLKKLINHPAIPRGVYMYGGVGRGKSFLMDCFFNAVPLRDPVEQDRVEALERSELARLWADYPGDF